MSYNLEILKKNTSYTILPENKLKELPTKNLLKVYKTLHSYTTYGGYCDCCGESYVKMYGDQEEKSLCQQVDENFEIYKKTLKNELNTREHLPKKKESLSNPKRQIIILRKKIKDYNLYLLPEEKIRQLYTEQSKKFRNDFKGISLTQVLELTKAIKSSKENCK